MSQSTCGKPGLELAYCGPSLGGAGEDAGLLPGVLTAIKRHEALLVEIERASSTGGFCWHPATGKMTCTREVYRIFELDGAAPVTLDLLAARVHPDDIPLLHDMIDRASAEASGFEYQLRLRFSARTIKYLQLTAHLTLSANGEMQYIGAIRDITRRHVSEETLGNVRCELARMARISSLGALTASIAHEVAQPLSGIMTNASTCLEMLGAETPDLDGVRETARRTIRDGERACEVITRLRALFGNRRGIAEFVDLNDVAREVIALSSSELRRHQVALRTELAENLPAVTGDRVQLQQVILNLLLNAAEAMNGIDDRPRQLLVRTETEGSDRVRMSVQDAGPGFGSHDVERLFEAFYTTKSGGMGIGLSVSRSIVESHRGRLWAERNSGPGATFAFSLPTCATQCGTGRLLKASNTALRAG
jgi:signal transduction histidine kinase